MFRIARFAEYEHYAVHTHTHTLLNLFHADLMMQQQLLLLQNSMDIEPVSCHFAQGAKVSITGPVVVGVFAMTF
jgi:hypothetical protein